MNVALRVTCAAEGCGQHFDLDVQTGADDLVDLSPHGNSSTLWIEALITLPAGWIGTGNAYAYRAWCRDHVRDGRRHEAQERGATIKAPSVGVTLRQTAPLVPLRDELRSLGERAGGGS